MQRTRKRSLDQYVEAFARCCRWDSKVFHTRPFGHHALVNVGPSVYQVSHFEDLMFEYASIFDTDPGLVYTGFPGELWKVFLDEKLTVARENWIIDLYLAWQQCWESQRRWIKHPLIYEQSKSKSYRQFNRLIKKYNEHPENLLKAAIRIDEPLFLPVIALAIKMQYKREDDFYRDCVRLMTERFPSQIGDGVALIKVGPEGQAVSENHTFFIYSVDEDF